MNAVRVPMEIPQAATTFVVPANSSSAVTNADRMTVVGVYSAE